MASVSSNSSWWKGAKWVKFCAYAVNTVKRSEYFRKDCDQLQGFLQLRCEVVDQSSNITHITKPFHYHPLKASRGRQSADSMRVDSLSHPLIRSKQWPMYQMEILLSFGMLEWLTGEQFFVTVRWLAGEQPNEDINDWPEDTCLILGQWLLKEAKASLREVL